MMEVHTSLLPKSIRFFKCRVLKRNYSSLLKKDIVNTSRIDVFSRALTVEISFLGIHVKDPCYFSNAFFLSPEPNVRFLTLAYPPGNFILNTYNSSWSSFIQTKIISSESVDFCITRLNNLKFYKKNKKYINLTKDFLTDPNFLFLAYMQIKSKAGNTTKAVCSETLDAITES